MGPGQNKGETRLVLFQVPLWCNQTVSHSEGTVVSSRQHLT